jgi:DNA-binding response OmpR family regulator
MAKKVLVLDDEEHITSLVKAYLEKEGFTVYLASNGKDGLRLAKSEEPDLVILDIMMPEMDGYSFLREFRKETSTPVIFLTAKVDEDERVVGLELGADDYITKPFYPRELMARVRAVLRRHPKTENAETIFQAADITLDTESHTVLVKDHFVDLTPSEFAILTTLLSVPGKVFTRMDLLDALQGVRYEGYERTIDLHIKNLRAKLKTNIPNQQYIETIYGVGYRFTRSSIQ